MNSSSLPSLKILALLLVTAVAAVVPFALGYLLFATYVAATALALAIALNDYTARRPGYTLAITARRSAALPLAA